MLHKQTFTVRMSPKEKQEWEKQNKRKPHLMDPPY